MYHIKNKYGNKKITVNGETFDSKKEYNRWYELNLLQRAGEISNLKRQEKFQIIPTQKDSQNDVVLVRYQNKGSVTMSIPLPPCGKSGQCPKRSQNCHGNCIDFLFYQANNEARAEAIRKEKELNRAPIERCTKLTEKVKKWHRRK